MRPLIGVAAASPLARAAVDQAGQDDPGNAQPSP